MSLCIIDGVWKKASECKDSDLSDTAIRGEIELCMHMLATCNPKNPSIELKRISELRAKLDRRRGGILEEKKEGLRHSSHR